MHRADLPTLPPCPNRATNDQQVLVEVNQACGDRLVIALWHYSVFMTGGVQAMHE